MATQRDGRAPDGDHVEAPDSDDPPQPGPRPELSPSFDQVGLEGARSVSTGRRIAARQERGQPEQQQAQGADRVGGGMGREHSAGRGEADEEAGDGGPRELGGGLGDPYGAVGPLDVGGEPGHRAGHAGLEHRAGHTVDEADRADLPEHHVPGVEQHGGQGLGAEPDEVGADHQLARAEPVGDDPAEDHESREGGGRRGHGEAHRARAVPVLQQARGQGDGQHRVPEPGDGSRHEEQREVPRPDRPRPRAVLGSGLDSRSGSGSGSAVMPSCRRLPW